MKTITRMIRYILISLLTMAIFFIALFVCCVSLENALPICLNFFHFFYPRTYGQFGIYRCRLYPDRTLHCRLLYAQSVV